MAAKFKVGDYVTYYNNYSSLDKLNHISGVVLTVDSEEEYVWDDEEDDDIPTGNFMYSYEIDFSEEISTPVYKNWWVDQNNLFKTTAPIVIPEPNDADII